MPFWPLIFREMHRVWVGARRREGRDEDFFRPNYLINPGAAGGLVQVPNRPTHSDTRRFGRRRKTGWGRAVSWDEKWIVGRQIIDRYVQIPPPVYPVVTLFEGEEEGKRGGERVRPRE